MDYGKEHGKEYLGRSFLRASIKAQERLGFLKRSVASIIK